MPNIIEKSEQKDFKVIVEACILFLNDKDRIERLATLNQSLLQAEKDDGKEKAKWLLKNLTGCLKLAMDPSKIGKYFHLNLGLDEAKSNLVKSLWEKHWTSIKETQSGHSLMISQLVDIEWKFGVTASSSHIDKVGNAFLQLKVVYDKGGKLESKFMGILVKLYHFYIQLYLE